MEREIELRGAQGGPLPCMLYFLLKKQNRSEADKAKC